MFRKFLLAGSTLVLALVDGTIPVYAEALITGVPGAVYIMSNSETGNQVLIYNRAGNGTLSYLVVYVATGGLGSGIGNTVPPDPRARKIHCCSVIMGSGYFAVNAGSDEISVFKVTSQASR